MTWKKLRTALTVGFKEEKQYVPSSKTYYDFCVWVGSHFLNGFSWLAIDAGTWSVDEGHGKRGTDHLHTVNHGVLRPAVWNCHVFKCGLTAAQSQDTFVNIFNFCLLGQKQLFRLGSRFTWPFVRSHGICNQPPCHRQIQKHISA